MAISLMMIKSSRSWWSCSSSSFGLSLFRFATNNTTTTTATTSTSNRMFASKSSSKIVDHDDNDSTTTTTTVEPRITLTDDATTIVCWHPEPEHPYEHTLPYTESSASLSAESHFKMEALVAGENIKVKYTHPRMNQEQVQAITYTNKDYWRRRRFDNLQMRPDHPRKGV